MNSEKQKLKQVQLKTKQDESNRKQSKQDWRNVDKISLPSRPNIGGYQEISLE